jgi:hypothetical protein
MLRRKLATATRIFPALSGKAFHVGSTKKSNGAVTFFSTRHRLPTDEEERHHQQSSQHDQQTASNTKNIKLEAIKSMGLTQLHNHTQDLISRTRIPLFYDDLVDAYGHKRPSIAQIQEASRLESALIDALEHHSSKRSTFVVGGLCIEVLGVEVSPDLKLARAYWCLPRGLDLRQLPDHKIGQALKRMQTILEERGGEIQRLVHNRLRAYHPPKIVWVAAEHVSMDMKRGVSLDSSRRKRR